MEWNSMVSGPGHFFTVCCKPELGPISGMSWREDTSISSHFRLDLSFAWWRPSDFILDHRFKNLFGTLRLAAPTSSGFAQPLPSPPKPLTLKLENLASAPPASCIFHISSCQPSTVVRILLLTRCPLSLAPQHNSSIVQTRCPAIDSSISNPPAKLNLFPFL
ncbi:hypothetical protein PM082_001816 [Marasmius tenuissimus]|nr:hypothetical protein PM082_001816 [Marasmius tenuissimus]